jgi:hypothetical protein
MRLLGNGHILSISATNPVNGFLEFKLDAFHTKEISPSLGLTLLQWNSPSKSLDHVALVGIASYSTSSTDPDTHAAILGGVLDLSGILQLGACYSWADHGLLYVLGIRPDKLPKSISYFFKGLGAAK